MASCIASCLDCADICQLDASLMSRDSPWHFDTCELCADICDQCAGMCEGSMQDVEFELLQQCADTCRRCADACREMASMRPSAEIH